MRTDIREFVRSALTACDAPLDLRERMLALVIERAVVAGHAEALANLRARGVLPVDAVGATERGEA